MLNGRLGLETARVPHADRHGCLWLRRGSLWVDEGTLRFRTAGSDDLPAGEYRHPVPDSERDLPGAGVDGEP